MVSPLATRVSMRNLEVVDGVCRSAFGCWGIDLAGVAAALVGVALALVVVAVAVHLTEATSLLDVERERLTAERDAFGSFAKRVSEIEVPEAGAAVSATGGITTVDATVPDGRLDRVREAYRETVMSVPHYEADYGEPLADNMAAEFGEDVAVAVIEGGRLSPQLKSALLAGSREARRSRTALLATLEAEAEAVEAARADLEAIEADLAGIEERSAFAERSYEALVEDWERLGGLADRCRDLIADRTERLRERQPATPPTAPDLQTYLYADLEVDHPVLADAAATTESIEAIRSRVLRSLTRRV